MPSALLRPCAYLGGCGALVVEGYCPDHRPRDTRPTATARGYGTRWLRFKEWWIAQIVQRGIAPVCGARWTGLSPEHSVCLQQGLFTGGRLHLDHRWPVRPAEREDAESFFDPERVQLLCPACHSRKTQSEQARGLV